VAFTIPDIELSRLANPNGSLATDSQLIDYVRQAVTVLQDGQPCERIET